MSFTIAPAQDERVALKKNSWKYDQGIWRKDGHPNVGTSIYNANGQGYFPLAKVSNNAFYEFMVSIESGAAKHQTVLGTFGCHYDKTQMNPYGVYNRGNFKPLGEIGISILDNTSWVFWLRTTAVDLPANTKIHVTLQRIGRHSDGAGMGETLWDGVPIPRFNNWPGGDIAKVNLKHQFYQPWQYPWGIIKRVRFRHTTASSSNTWTTVNVNNIPLREGRKYKAEYRIEVDGDVDFSQDNQWTTQCKIETTAGLVSVNLNNEFTFGDTYPSKHMIIGKGRDWFESNADDMSSRWEIKHKWRSSNNRGSALGMQIEAWVEDLGPIP